MKVISLILSTSVLKNYRRSCNIRTSSTGPDMLNPRILGALEDKLARSLTHIFNNSVETGNIPEDWKSANVTAIQKKGSRQEPGNYRPISLTLVVCKTMKRLVKGRLIIHFEIKLTT